LPRLLFALPCVAIPRAHAPAASTQRVVSFFASASAEGFSDAALRGAVALLQDKIDGVKKALAQPRAPAVRKKCEGGCGFWGDEQQDGYCSLCYKKKFMGIKTTPDAGKPKQCIKDDCSHFGCAFHNLSLVVAPKCSFFFCN